MNVRQGGIARYISDGIFAHFLHLHDQALMYDSRRYCNELFHKIMTHHSVAIQFDALFSEYQSALNDYRNRSGEVCYENSCHGDAIPFTAEVTSQLCFRREFYSKLRKSLYNREKVSIIIYPLPFEIAFQPTVDISFPVKYEHVGEFSITKRLYPTFNIIKFELGIGVGHRGRINCHGVLLTMIANMCTRMALVLTWKKQEMGVILAKA